MKLVGIELEVAPRWRANGFTTTRWSVVVSGADANSDDAQDQHALSELCRIYWRPIFAFVSSRVSSPEDAQDLTQEFFRMILKPGWLQRADQNRGRFRCLLLQSLENFMRDAALKGQRQRRGGGAEFVRWEDWAEDAPSDVTVPSQALARPASHIFDFRWAVTVVEQTLHRMAEECEKRGRRRLFEALSPYFTSGDDACYATVSEALGSPATDLKAQLHAMRQRYRTLLREEVARTVRDPSEVDDEIRNLCGALAAVM